MLDTQTAPYGAFLLRASLGILFLAHGALKLFVFTPAGTVEFFAQLGLPPAVAYLTMLAGLGGGTLLLVGLMTPLGAPVLVPLGLGPVLFAPRANGSLFSHPRA